MVKKEKIGRRATKEDRARAAKWVELYRLAQASPDGRHCLNPQDELECQAYIDENDPEPLLDALERFVEHGTFVDMRDIDPLLVRIEVSDLRAGGEKYAAAIAAVAEKHHTSDSNINRMLALSKRDTDWR